MPSLAAYAPYDEYNPELAPQPVTMPDGSVYTGETQQAAPENYIPGSTYIPPGAAESPQTSGPPPEPAYNITGGGSNTSDYTGAPAPAPEPTLPQFMPVGSGEVADFAGPYGQRQTPMAPDGYIAPTEYGNGAPYKEPSAPGLVPGTPAYEAATITGGPPAQHNPGDPSYGRTFQSSPPPPPPPPMNTPASRSAAIAGPMAQRNPGNPSYGRNFGAPEPASLPPAPPPTAPKDNYFKNILDTNPEANRRGVPEAMGLNPSSTPIQWPPVPDEFSQPGNPVPSQGSTSGEPFKVRRTSPIYESAGKASPALTLTGGSPSGKKGGRDYGGAMAEGLGLAATNDRLKASEKDVAPPLTWNNFIQGFKDTNQQGILAQERARGGNVIGTGGANNAESIGLRGSPFTAKGTTTGQTVPVAPTASGNAGYRTGTPSQGAGMSPTMAGGEPIDLSNIPDDLIRGYSLGIWDKTGMPTPATLDASSRPSLDEKTGMMIPPSTIKGEDGNYYFIDNGAQVTAGSTQEWYKRQQAGGGAQGTPPNGQLADSPVAVTPVGTTTGTAPSGGSSGNYTSNSSGGGGGGTSRSSGGGGGGGYSKRSYGSSGGSDYGDFDPDMDGDGKISAKEARMARKKRGKRGKGQTGMNTSSMPPDIRAYILGQLGEGFGHPVGGWPETGMPGKKKGK